MRRQHTHTQKMSFEAEGEQDVHDGEKGTVFLVETKMFSIYSFQRCCYFFFVIPV